MKSLGEVIKAYEYCINNNYRDCRGCPYGCEDGESGCTNAEEKNDALHYLKEYRKMDSLDAVALAKDDNPPLSWDELKTMEGKPAWVECVAKRWIVIADFREDVNGAEYFEATDGGRFLAKTQGDLWQAYRKER